MNLFLVEDSPADVFLVREAMKFEGLPFQLLLAEDGELAIRILDRVDAEVDPVPDLLLIDLNVPRKDGIQVLERLRRIPRCQTVPVIVFSSSNSAVDRQRAFAMGANEYFRKPATLDEFMQLGRVVHTVYRKAVASEQEFEGRRRF